MFIYKNQFENVWRMVGILSHPQCVNGNIQIGWTAIYRSDGIKILLFYMCSLSLRKQCFTTKEWGNVYEATYFSGVDTAPVILKSQ